MRSFSADTIRPRKTRTVQRLFSSGLLLAGYVISGAGEYPLGAAPKPDDLNALPLTKKDGNTFFRKVTLKDLNPEDRSAVTVNAVPANTQALRAGLRVNDRILAIHGYRVHSGSEYSYVRYYKAIDKDVTLHLIVERRGHLVEISIESLQPVRKAGFNFVDRQEPFDVELEKLGVELPPKMVAPLRRLSVRAIFALQAWLNADDGNAENTAWLGDFVELYGHLVNQDWKKAMPPEHPSPVPFFKKLSNFYLSIARRHQDGEQPPDPTSHNVELDYYVMHYPMPRTVYPELGKLNLSDQFLQRWLELRRENPFALPPDEKLFPRSQPKNPESIDTYLSRVKWALQDPGRYGGFPFRYAGGTHDVSKPTSRRKMIEIVTKRMEKQDQDEPFYALTLAALYSVDAKPKEVARLIKQLKEVSPYLAFRAFQNARSAFRLWQRNWQNLDRQLLREIDPKPFPMTSKPSRMVDFVLARSRVLSRSAQRFDPNYLDRGIYYPANVAVAFLQKEPQNVQVRKLNSDLAQPTFAEQRKDLLKRIETAAFTDTTREDLQRLARAGRDRRGSGLILDSAVKILYASYFTDVQSWSFGDAQAKHLWDALFLERPGEPDKGYEAAYKLIQTLDWDQPETAKRQLEDAYRKYGRPATALMIGEELKQHGFKELGAHYTSQGLKAFIFFFQTTNLFGQRYGRYWGEFSGLLCVDGGAPRMGEVFARQYINAKWLPNELPIFLNAARAQLDQDKLDEAVDFLLKSLKAPPAKKLRPIYLMEGKVSNSNQDYRAFIVRKLMKHTDFTEKHRQKLAHSEIAKSHPELTKKSVPAGAP